MRINMYFPFVLLVMAAVSPIDMKTVEELEGELEILKSKIANLEKCNNQMEIKMEHVEDKLMKTDNKIEKIEERTDEKMKELEESTNNKIEKIEKKTVIEMKKMEEGTDSKIKIMEEKTENKIKLNCEQRAHGNMKKIEESTDNEMKKAEAMTENIQYNNKETKLNINNDLKNDTESRLNYLEELSKMQVMRTCDEMFQFGIKTSDFYFVDPDGRNIGQKPTRVWCNFTEDGLAITEILHNSEDVIAISHCHDAGCYSRDILYTSPDDQIQSLIQLSDQCEQSIKYDCLLAPLKKNGVDYGFWIDRENNPQIYWDGAHANEHVCGCHYEEGGCIEEDSMSTKCNCDAELPELLSDMGSIRNMSALPIKSLKFGGMTYEIQQAFHTLGRLRCWGRASYEEGTSCTSIKRSGMFNNGYFNIKRNQQENSQLVYCNFTASHGYEDENGMVEKFIESSEDHFLVVEKDIAGIEDAVTAIEDDVTALEYKSSYCAYSNREDCGNCDISFDKFLLEDNNIPDAEFNLGTGMFTAGMDGVYRCEISFRSESGGPNYVYLYLRLNGVNVDESVMFTKILTSAHSWEMVGRNLLLELKKGDNVSLFRGDAYYSDELIFCISLVK